MNRDEESRFRAKVTEDPDTGCWEWTAHRTRLGYGRFYAGRYVQASRWSFEFFRGPIPDGLEIDHLCRNRACVNPDHLEPVSHAENCRRVPGRMVECPTGPGWPCHSSEKCRPCRAAYLRARRAARQAAIAVTPEAEVA